jgi:hypothetical protein
MIVYGMTTPNAFVTMAGEPSAVFPEIVQLMKVTSARSTSTPPRKLPEIVIPMTTASPRATIPPPVGNDRPLRAPACRDPFRADTMLLALLCPVRVDDAACLGSR